MRGNSMTKTEVKNLLFSYQQLVMKQKIWKECLKLSNDICLKKDHQKNLLQLNIINESLNLLKEEHKFVIEKHLIQHYVWKETLELFEEKWGGYEQSLWKNIKAYAVGGTGEDIGIYKNIKIRILFSRKLWIIMIGDYG